MKNVTLVCNAHLDIVWLWNWEEGAAEALSTFRTAADFCDKYNGFVFNHNEAILYQWVEEFEPALFERIKELVKKGRWHIMGGWYLQPDCIMLTGESFVRQIQEGRKYFFKAFNAMPRVAVNFDAFGHSLALPQILYKAGYTGYIVCRAGNAEREVQSNDFMWQGLDESKIIVHYSDENYNHVFGKAAQELQTWLSRHENGDEGLFLWGIGDHGGGPSHLDMEKLKSFFESRKDISFKHGTLEEYFDKLKQDKLPLYKKPLTPVSEGCYTSQTEIKRLHRRLESRLLSCEKMLSCAALSKKLSDYPEPELKEAWGSIMRAQFHDTLPGSSIKSGEKATLWQLGHGMEIVSRLMAKAFFALCSGLPKSPDGQSSIIVFNPHPFEADITVDCEVSLPKQNWDNCFMMPVVTKNGKEIESQLEKEESSFEIDWRKRCVFKAVLPPFTAGKFDCAFYPAAARPSYTAQSENGLFKFEGKRLKAAVNANTGLLDYLFIDDKPILKKDAFKLVLMNDFYNSWGVGFKSFNDTRGSFSLMDSEEGTCFSGLGANKAESVRIVEDGAVRTVIEAVFKYGRSSAHIMYKLSKTDNELEIELNVVWLEKDCLLKLCIPTELNSPSLYGQTAYGRMPLDTDGTEQVMHQWCALADKESDTAVAVINNGVYGMNCQSGEMRISLVRGAGFAMSDLGEKKALILNRVNERMDQGEHSYKFWLSGGSINEVMHGLDKAAMLKNEPVYALGYNPSGAGSVPGSGVKIDADNIILSAFKKEEGTSDYILRLYESEGLSQKTQISLGSCVKTLEFMPFEIKTLRYSQSENTLCETELLEACACRI